MGEPTPLQCFFAGVTLSITCLAILWFFLKRAIAQHRQRYPELVTARCDATRLEDQSGVAVQLRLQELEKRLSDLERQMHRQATV